MHLKIIKKEVGARKVAEKLKSNLVENCIKFTNNKASLKKQLEEVLNRTGSGDTKINKVLKTMEQLERDILEKGFNLETIQRMQQLEYQLLKLRKPLFSSKEKILKENLIQAHCTFQKETIKRTTIQKTVLQSN